ncbi:hypothetical protein M0M43_03155 [Pimelobacter simplex]|nr:hypothetical protein M0M43_03155 [Pimelobacter simplex]UUW98825.1 hypothetical protein M0M48_21670 [Pimelobacter simplex]
MLGGTSIPFPTTTASHDVVVDGTSTQFTVATAGDYQVSFRVQSNAGLLASVRARLNGAPVASLDDGTVVSTSSWGGSAVLTLAAGDTISVEAYGLLGALALDTGTGASLQLVRVG